MKYEVKKTDKSSAVLTIEVTPEEVKKHKAKAAEEISNDVKVPGFRKGHIPLDVLEKHVDKRYIIARAQELAVQVSYAEAVMKEKLQVVSSPKIKFLSDTLNEEDGIKFEAEVAIMPEIKVKDHKKIKVAKEEAKVDKKEIEDTVEDLSKYFMTWTDVERASKKGDRVELDFEGFDPKEKDESGNAKAIPNTASKNHPVVIGENSLVPGFEENLEGLKKGDKKEFELTFPKEYHKKDFQNKKVLFKVEVKRLEEGKKPELNEEFVEKVTGKKMSVEELKKDIEKNILARKEKDAATIRENKYLEEVLKHTEGILPDAMIEEELDYLIEEIAHDLGHQGLTLDKYLEATKMKLEDLRKKYREEAEKRIKVRLALTFLLKEEVIEVSDKEVEEEMKKFGAMHAHHDHDGHDHHDHDGHDHAEDHERELQIKNRLLLKKLFDKLLA